MDPLVELAQLRGQVASLIKHAQQQPQQQSQSLPSHQGSRIKPPPMVKFTGSVGPEVDNFIRDLKIQYDVYGPREFPEHDMHSRLRFAGAYMSGTAADWWEQEDKSAILSWDMFVERLHSRFRPLQAVDNARHRLRNLKQRGHVSGYCSQFLAILAHIPDSSPAQQVFDFLEGLTSEDAKSRIRQAKTKTVREAMDLAVSMEAHSHQSRAGSGGFQYRGGFRPSGQSSASSSSSSVPMDINAVHADVDAYESGSYDSAGAADGHADRAQSIEAIVEKLVEARLAALHQPASSSGSSQGHNNRGRGNDSGRYGGNKFSAEKERLYNEGKCFKCKKPGHQSRQCPQKDFQ